MISNKKNCFSNNIDNKMTCMSKIFLFIVIIIFASSCGQDKPEFLINENYSYLKRPSNNILLISRVRVDNEDENFDINADPVIIDVVKNSNFQLTYRGNLAKEILRWDRKGKLKIEYSEEAEDESFQYFKYFGKKYPRVNRRYNLILEINIYFLLSTEISYLSVSKREDLRLLDAKSGKLYLSSHVNQTFRSIGNKVKLRKNKKQFRLLLQSLVNRSNRKIARYLLNLEPVPDEDDITPILPKVEQY